MYNNYYSELYHFGIKGQKWGVRRYQNEDGSLTPEGYIHYGRKSKRLGKTESHLSKAEDYGRNYTGYEYETRKAAAPLVGLGIGGYVGATQMALGASVVESVLPALLSTVGGAAGFVAGSGAILIGQQIVNKLLMHQHGKVSAKKKAIDSKLSQYEASSKKNKLNHSELYHFGILGQKWGVRRYQNKDGSLTPEGYEHYGRRKNNSNKVQRLVNDYKRNIIDNEINNFAKSLGKDFKVDADSGGDYAEGTIKSKKYGSVTCLVNIPDDIGNDDTRSKLLNTYKKAEKDIDDIIDKSKVFVRDEIVDLLDDDPQEIDRALAYIENAKPSLTIFKEAGELLLDGYDYDPDSFFGDHLLNVEYDVHRKGPSSMSIDG